MVRDCVAVQLLETEIWWAGAESRGGRDRAWEGMKYIPSYPCQNHVSRLSTEIRKNLKKASNMFITKTSKSVCMWATDSPKAESLFLLPALSLSPSPQHVLMCVLMCHLCVHTHTPEFLRTCAWEKILPEELLRHNQELWDCSSHLLMKGSL